MINFIKDYLAAQGRNGDSELRNVKGELSHVNPNEAYLIDNYGSLGEDTTQLVGSGTINPDTGLRQYDGSLWSGHPAHHWTLQNNPIANVYDETIGVGGIAGGISDIIAGENPVEDWTLTDNFLSDIYDETLGVGGIAGGIDDAIIQPTLDLFHGGATAIEKRWGKDITNLWGLGDIYDETIGVGGLAGGIHETFDLNTPPPWADWTWSDNPIANIWDETIGVGGLFSNWPSGGELPNPYSEGERIAPGTGFEDDLYDKYGDKLDWEEFKTMDPNDFIGMSEEEKWAVAADLSEYGDMPLEDFQKYMPIYDAEEEAYKRETGAMDIARSGQKRQAPLQKMMQKMDTLQTKQNFESTGNPMIDRQRFNIFQDIGNENTEIWRGLVHDIDVDRTDFMSDFATDLLGYEEVRQRKEQGYTHPDEGFQWTEPWDYTVGKDGVSGFIGNLWDSFWGNDD